MTAGTRQVQIGGVGNIQISQEIRASFASLLVRTSTGIKGRTFNSNEVRDHFFSKLDEIVQALGGDHEKALKESRYIVFPFQAIAVPESLQDTGYITSLLDTLTIIAFLECRFEILSNHINISIEDKHIFGIYYTLGNLNLVDSYTRLLKAMIETRIAIPGSFVCLPLATNGADYSLEEGKINNIVTNIYGDSDYIKPLKTGSPKCINLSSYIISEVASVDLAKQYIRRILGLE